MCGCVCVCVCVCVRACVRMCTCASVWEVVEVENESGNHVPPIEVSHHPNISSIALLLSALKSQAIPYTPASIKRTLENTATPLGAHDTFSVGHGVIQVS